MASKKRIAGDASKCSPVAKSKKYFVRTNGPTTRPASRCYASRVSVANTGRIWTASVATVAGCATREQMRILINTRYRSKTLKDIMTRPALFTTTVGRNKNEN